MVRETTHFTCENVDRDDLLPIAGPWRDIAVRVHSPAMEGIGPVFRGKERPILEWSSRNRRHVAGIVPR